MLWFTNWTYLLMGFESTFEAKSVQFSTAPNNIYYWLGSGGFLYQYPVGQDHDLERIKGYDEGSWPMDR